MHAVRTADGRCRGPRDAGHWPRPCSSSLEDAGGRDALGRQARARGGAFSIEGFLAKYAVLYSRLHTRAHLQLRNCRLCITRGVGRPRRRRLPCFRRGFDVLDARRRLFIARASVSRAR